MKCRLPLNGSSSPVYFVVSGERNNTNSRMKRLLKICVILMIIAAIWGAPVDNDAQATVTNYEYRLTEDGYIFVYSTSNGITRKEKGEYIKVPNDDENMILRVIGSYSYTDEKGEIHEVNYGADENGSSFGKTVGAAVSVAAVPESAAPAFFPITTVGKDEKLSPYEPKGISSAALASLSG